MTLAVLIALGACGTTYDVPVATDAELAESRRMFGEAQAGALGPRLGVAAALAQYREVAARIEPVAEAFCREQTADRPRFDCDVTLLIDAEVPDRNAYQTYVNGRPVVAITLPLVADARNPDELAFVLSHEFAHHIADHIEKGRQQQVAGALIMGALMAYGQASASAADPYRSTAMDGANMQNAVAGGAALGGAAFSQTYELEADTIGAYIAAAAGYDPVVGARDFARPEAPRTPGGALSFWGTHPPSETRLATVLAAVGRMAAPAE